LTGQNVRRMVNMRKRAIVQLAAVALMLSPALLVGGCSEQATTPAQVTSQDTSPPAPPVGLDVLPRNSGLVLNWSPNVEPDLVGYNVYLYSPSPERPESYVRFNNQPISATEFRHGKLRPNQQMIFRLTAVDLSGNESGFSSMIVASTEAIQLRGQ